jgi:replication factor C subunit 2/4
LVGKEQLVERLQMIAVKEDVAIDSEALDTVIKTSGGDLRRAITCLQSCARLKKKGEPIEKNEVVELMGVVPDKWILGLLDITATKNYDKVATFMNDLLLEAFSAFQIMLQLHDRIIEHPTFTDNAKANICEKLAVSSCDRIF